jgi:O-antigen ligase
MVGAMVLAYYGIGDTALLLVSTVVPSAVLLPRAKIRLYSLDWAVLLVLTSEVPSLLLSQYSANSSLCARIVCVSVLYYFLARLVTTRQAVAVVALVGVGGILLAGYTLSKADERIRVIMAAGFSDTVAFRWYLVGPPAPWVLGEWFTLVLLTLPFAFAALPYFWFCGQRVLAAIAALVPALIAGALFLSCSRAVFVGTAVFVVAVMGLGAVYRVVRLKTAVTVTTVTLCSLGLVLFAENSVYPGIAEAYTRRHTSQVRSTEGRLAIWKRSVDVFALSPWWGVGSGNAPLFLTSSADQEETTGFASRTFSLPIQILVEKGTIGAALYLTVLILAAWEAHRKLRSPKVSPQLKGMTCCFAAGVIAVLFRELTYSSLLEHAATAMLFAMCLALLVAPEGA